MHNRQTETIRHVAPLARIIAIGRAQAIGAVLRMRANVMEAQVRRLS
jgi:hypothetical protein